MLSTLTCSEPSDEVPSLDRPLRILMVAPQPFFRPRGTPFSVLHRVRALGEAGCRIDLVTYPFGADVNLPGLRIIRARRVPGIHDVKIGPSLAKVALDLSLMAATIRALATEAYDVVHSHEEAAFFCAWLARRRGLLHVYDMHSSLPQQLANFDAFNFSPFRKVFEYFERHVLTSCDGVITICQELADVAAEIAPGTPRAMIENTGDDTAVFSATRGSVAPEVAALTGPVVLYTGTMEAYQGIDLLLEAFRFVSLERPDASLVLVGGRVEQIARFQREAERLGVADRTHFVGQVDPSSIPAYIDAATVIVSPRSSGTNTPLKIYGYLRSGKPIVATNLRTHTQILNPRVAELAPPTAEGLAAGLLRVLQDPARAAALAAEARKLADSEYSDTRYRERVVNFYNMVIRGSETQFGRAAPVTAP